MTEKPTISVIIPTYNRAHLIARAIKSVLSQSYQDIELIIIDDGSFDNTEMIIKQFQESDKRIKYIIHDKNKGGSAARNTGIKAANGEYIAFLDSDDEWLLEKLERQMRIFESSSPETGIVYTGIIYIDEMNEDNNLKYTIPKKRGSIYEDLLVNNWVGTTSTIMIRKECFEKSGLFDESLPGCQDWEMWIRLAKEYQFDFVKDPLIKYYHHNIHNDRITIDLESKINGINMVINKFHSEFALRPKVCSELYFTIGNLYCQLGNTKKGREEFLKAIRFYPFSLKYFIYLSSALFTPRIYFKLARIKKCWIFDWISK